MVPELRPLSWIKAGLSREGHCTFSGASTDYLCMRPTIIAKIDACLA
jgi:hypothetical protein